MTRHLRIASFLLALFGLAGSASEVSAQCPPNARFCAQASVGGHVVLPSRGGQVVITIGPPPPPVVVVRPAPPPPPPPRVVYVQPPQPQVVYVRPQPQQYYYAPQPQYAPQPVATGRRNVRGTSGLHFFIAGAGASDARLAGLGGAIRFRPRERLGVDIGVGVFGGTDYYGRSRAEIPVTADVLMFLNPQKKAQFYLLAGAGMSFAYGERSDGTLQHTYTYVGAQTGAGIEFRITRGFALNLDFRGFLRRQPNGSPEFVSSTGATSRTSAGWIGQFGTTFYF